MNISVVELGDIMKQIEDEETDFEELVNSLEIANYSYQKRNEKFLEWFSGDTKKAVSLLLFHLKRFQLTHYMNQ